MRIMKTRARRVGDDGAQADLEGIGDAGLANDGGQPEADGVGAHLDAEVDGAHEPDARADEDGEDGVVGLGVGFFVDFGGDDALLFRREPICVDDAVVEGEEDDDAEDDGGDGFEEEEPLPSGDAVECRRRSA